MEWAGSAKDQYEQDQADLRNLEVINLIEIDGHRQIDVARQFQLSQSRIFQLYHRGLKKREAGRF